MAAVKCARAALRAARFVVVLLVGLSGGARVAHAQPPPEAIEYYAADALGSVRIVFTETGQVLGRSEYLPFGETFNQAGSLPRQRFTGQERDGEAGMDYFHARNLLARTGRMNAPDPLFGNALVNAQRWNRYGYALNNPLRVTDPTGLEPEAATFYSWIVGGYAETAPLKLKATCAICAPSPEQMSDAAREGSADLGYGAAFHDWLQSQSTGSAAYYGQHAVPTDYTPKTTPTASTTPDQTKTVPATEHEKKVVLPNLLEIHKRTPMEIFGGREVAAWQCTGSQQPAMRRSSSSRPDQAPSHDCAPGTLVWYSHSHISNSPPSGWDHTTAWEWSKTDPSASFYMINTAGTVYGCGAQSYWLIRF